jgi:transcriptional regulator with XRE-family HTH domain
MKGRGKREPTSIDLRFGQRVRARRIMLGMSQTELGAALDVTFQQIQKYESGINRVSVNDLEKLAATLRVPITYFFDSYGPECGEIDSSGVDVPSFLATSAGVALFRAFQDIESETMRGAVITFLQGLTKQRAGPAIP